jgi:hypothetical protein
MATMISEEYDALRAAGVPEEQARRAAEAIGAESLATRTDIAALKVDLAVLESMVGFNLAVTLAVLWKVFS